MSIPQLRASLALWRTRYAYRLAREKFWQRLHNAKGANKWQALRLEAKTKIHLRLDQIKEAQKPKPKPPSRRIVMYDSTEVSQIPSNPPAVAGYVDGKYANFNLMLKRFPRAHHLSIAVFPNDNAHCLDVEPGDATPTQAPEWVRRQHARGIKRPVLYGSRSSMDEIKPILARNGIKRTEVLLWVADPTGTSHIPSGFDACQWNWKALGRNLDESLCEPWFFGL
jgi:hypothetical protein